LINDDKLETVGIFDLIAQDFNAIHKDAIMKLKNYLGVDDLPEYSYNQDCIGANYSFLSAKVINK
jgi:hypothetical protein